MASQSVSYSEMRSSINFFERAKNLQGTVKTVSLLAKTMEWDRIIREIPDGHKSILFRALSSKCGDSDLPEEVSAAISRLRQAGYRDEDFTLLLIPSAEFAKLGRTAPVLIVNYEKSGIEVKYVLKFTDYKEFLSQRVYHAFLKYCPQMQELDMHVCRTAAISSLFGEEASRYHLDELPEPGNEHSRAMDFQEAVGCRNAVNAILSPLQKQKWNELAIPIVLISETVDGATLREFILDGKFQKLGDQEKRRLCTQLGMGAALDLVFGNHDRIIHDTDRSNLGNLMLTKDSEGSLHCWLIDNGDVPPDFGENLTIQRKDYINEESTFERAMKSLGRWCPGEAQTAEDLMFMDFIAFVSSEAGKESFRGGIGKMCEFFEELRRSPPDSGLKQEFARISENRLVSRSVPEPAPVAASAAKYVPRHRRGAVAADRG